MRRALVTIGLILAVLLLEWVPVPGVESALYNLEPYPLTLGMLGLRPLLSAFFWVECAALIVPRGRRLRVEQAGRARLTRAALVLGLVFAVPQAWGVSLSVSGPTEGGLVEFSQAEALVLIVSLSGTVAVTAWLGRLMTERGLGSGLSVLVGAMAASELVRGFVDQARSQPGELVQTLAVSLFFVIAWAAILLRYRDFPRLLATLNPMPAPRDDGDRTPERGAYRARSRDDEPSTLQLHLPASGSYPIVLLLWWCDLPYRFRPLATNTDLQLLQLAAQSPWAQALLVGAAALCASWCFHRPARMARAAEQLGLEDKQYRLDSLRASIKRAAVISALLLVAFAFAMYGLKVRELGVAVLEWGIVVAVALDLGREWRATRGADFVRVADLHRVYVATLVSERLRKAGIPFVIRGLHHRTLGQFFAPFVPMTVLVKSAQSNEARELVGDIC